MTEEIVVGMYDSRAEAEDARARLIEQGVREDRISIEEAEEPPRGDRVARQEAAEPLPEDRGISGFIARMFSGALMDDANIRKYTEALHDGRCLLAVRTESVEKRQLASTILARGGPRIYALPNAPTGWNEASGNDPASIGGIDADPARPEGLLTDAEGLPVRADAARLSNAPRGNRDR